MLTHKLTRNSFIGKLSLSTTCGLCATARPTLPQTTNVVKPNRTAAISATPAANRSAPAVGDQRPRPIRDPAVASGLQGGSYLLLHDRDDQAIALVKRARRKRERLSGVLPTFVASRETQRSGSAPMTQEPSPETSKTQGPAKA